MFALGQKRTFAVQKGTSALPPKADMCSALAHVRFGPIADKAGFFRFVLEISYSVLDPASYAASEFEYG